MFPFSNKEVLNKKVLNKKKIKLDMKNIPVHIAVVMDGNGRWAKKHAIPKKAGHKAGAKTLEDISRGAIDLGVKHLTVYAFSTENWKRSQEEVNGIMELLRSYLKNYIERAKKDDVRVHIIGDITGLDIDIQAQIKELEELTKDKKGMSLHIALNYGGRDEIIRAVKKISTEVLSGEITVSDIDMECIDRNLDTKGIPDPELFIRTSGEERISNFLLWQIAYSELYFSDKLWPDFNIEDFKLAIVSYQNRERRFGGRKS